MVVHVYDHGRQDCAFFDAVMAELAGRQVSGRRSTSSTGNRTRTIASTFEYMDRFTSMAGRQVLVAEVLLVLGLVLEMLGWD